MGSTRNYLEVELEERLKSDGGIWSFIREGSLDGVWFWDLEQPENEYMSPEFWRLFGYDPDTKRHSPAEWQDIIHPDDLEAAKAALDAHLADPDCPYDLVVRYRHADGGTIWVRCRGIAIRDDAGRPIRLVGAHNDLTELKRREIAADVAQYELETVFNATQSGIIGLDAAGTIVRCNKRARHMLGGVSEPVPFAWPVNVVFLDGETLKPLDASADPVRRALSGKILGSETHLLNRVQPGEEGRYVRMTSSQVTNIDSNISCVVVMDDVSEEVRNRQVAERQSRLDALGQLTGGIAHDFNNMLASQLYAIELAKSSQDAAKLHHYLNVVTQSIERGRALTTRLMAFANRQPGLAVVRRTADVFAEFEQLVRPMLEAKIEITFETSEPELLHFCDPVQLETALMNLVLNARDAILSSGSGSHIDVRARPVRDPEADENDAEGNSQRYVEISVSDNGPGMDSETLARSTDPFFTTKGAGGGSGLGLAMVYGFVRQADGNLRVYSEQGVGTTVQITLPRGTSTGEREHPMPQDLAEVGHGETVLVVEDELQLLVMMTDMLEELGYVVTTAHSGAEAMELIGAGERFDVLLADIVMPGQIGGFELAAKVREIYPEMPVIYTSGYTGFTASEMGAVQAPMLQKPTAPLELAKALAKALQRAPLHVP